MVDSFTAGVSSDAALSQELEDHVSRHLVCPISHRVMDVPVISPSGHTYDCDSMEQWLKRRPVDPMSLQPISISSLYLNRALQDEIIEQLERLAVKAAQLGDDVLADTARAKIQRMGELAAIVSAAPKCRGDRAILDRLAGQCSCWAAWLGLFAWEQVLVFTTSFGAILCLVLDARTLLLHRADRGGPSPGARPPALLQAFLRLAIAASSAPGHWQLSWKLVLAALRGALFLSVGPLFLSLGLGGIFSLVQFGRRCAVVRAVEFERAMHNRRFVQALQTCSAVTGLCSLALATRLIKDYRDFGWK